MKIFINALTIHPGGGLTVIKGLSQSIKHALPSLEIIILVGNQLTLDNLKKIPDLKDDVVRPFQTSNSALLFIYQNIFLEKKIDIKSNDIVISLNHYLLSLSCKQIVYHVNYRRFSKDFRTGGILLNIQEYLRDYTSKQALLHAESNVFESDFLLTAAKNFYRVCIKNPSVIYFGLMKELSELDLASIPTSISSNHIVAVTSPNPHKDNETLLRTLKELIRREPNKGWILDFVGGTDPSQWADLREYAAIHGVADRIIWHGFCDQRKLTPLLQNALCLISTSRLESFAMVAIEAMSRDCPPIVANCAAMPESIGNAGLLAEPASASSFADCVQKISNSEHLRDNLILEGRKWIQDFQWNRCGEKFLQVISQLSA